VRRIAVLAGLTIAGATGVAGIGVLIWGGVVAAFVSSDGATPGEAPGFVLCLAGMLIFALAVAMWRGVLAMAHDPEQSEDDALVVMLIVWWGGLAVLALWIGLRVAGVIGPLVTERGL
jgi:hypothetical protein